MNITVLCTEIQEKTDPEKAKILSRFFKTGKGQYGEGDLFLGITVPIQREIAKKFQNIPLGEVEKLLKNDIHEYRLISLLILICKNKKADKYLKETIVHLYLRNTKYINNWDLVDLSAPHIVGAYYEDKDRKLLSRLAHSKSLWERRIAMLSCFWFIKKNDFADALHIAEILLNDTHDLIHKAVGWMLREIGKRDMAIEERFLQKHYRAMPRTMLRYAIERFPEKKRQSYLRK